MAEKDYNKDQCVYGPNSDATCKFCSHMCEERGKGFKNRIIKGEFTKKFIEEVQRMIKLKKEGKDLHFENKDREIHHTIIKEDDI